ALEHEAAFGGDGQHALLARARRHLAVRRVDVDFWNNARIDAQQRRREGSSGVSEFSGNAAVDSPADADARRWRQLLSGRLPFDGLQYLEGHQVGRASQWNL